MLNTEVAKANTRKRIAKFYGKHIITDNARVFAGHQLSGSRRKLQKAFEESFFFVRKLACNPGEGF